METETTTTTDAAPADVITSPETAARKCPNCESLMEAATTGESAFPIFKCGECGHEVPRNETTRASNEAIEADTDTKTETGEPDGSNAETAEPAAEPRSMACKTCGLQILVSPLSSGHGFKLIAIEKAVAGVDMPTTFGASKNGFPICPIDSVGLIPLGPTPVGEAFRGIQDALKDTTEPVQPRLPGTTVPFNVDAAFKAIVAKNREVDEARGIYEAAKKEAKEAKDALDSEEALLGKLISEFERRRRDQEASERGTLRPEQASVCFSERMTGQPCHICREARKRVKEDESHNDADLRVASLHEHLARRGVHLTEFDLSVRDDEHVAALEAFAHDETATLPPFVLAAACVAGPAGDEGQRCTTCGVVLHNKTDEDEEGATPYPEGDRVGLDCAGDPNAPAATEDDAPEPARQPQRRHKTRKDAAAAKSKAAKAERAAAPAKAAPTQRKKRTRSR